MPVAFAKDNSKIVNLRVVATALLKTPFEKGYSKEWNDALYELLRRLG